MKTRNLLLCFMTSVAAAFFLPLGFNSRTYTKICLYSNDPSQFQPMCIMCPNSLYPSVLSTCMNGGAIPNNVSYTQANCIVGNCAINITRKKRDAMEDKLHLTSSSEVKSMTFQPKSDPMTFQPESDPILLVPYTTVINGQNITVTSVEEYFVLSDENSQGTTSNINQQPVMVKT